MNTCYQIISENDERTRCIGKEFGKACETLRPKDAVWGVAMFGKPNVGKSTFSEAFSLAVLNIHGKNFPGATHEKMADHVNDTTMLHIRCGDSKGDLFGEKVRSSFIRPRLEGYGGYDILEHARFHFPHILRITMLDAGDQRSIVIRADRMLAAASPFREALFNLDARCLI